MLALVTSAYKSSHKRSAGGTTRVDTPSVHANELRLCLGGCLPLPITLFAIITSPTLQAGTKVNFFSSDIEILSPFNRRIICSEFTRPLLSYFYIELYSFLILVCQIQKILVSWHCYNLERMWHMKNPCNQGSILG